MSEMTNDEIIDSICEVYGSPEEFIHMLFDYEDDKLAKRKLLVKKLQEALVAVEPEAYSWLCDPDEHFVYTIDDAGDSYFVNSKIAYAVGVPVTSVDLALRFFMMLDFLDRSLVETDV